MKSFVPLEEAQQHLAELIEALIPGQKLFITKDDHTIATLFKEALPLKEPRVPGSAKDKILYMADDFDATPEGFEEYMP